MTPLHTAARMALDALEKIYDAAPIDQTRYDLCKALRSALAQPAPEPVAWYLPSPDGDDSIFRDHRTVIACTGNKWEGFLPLYAAPPAAPMPEPSDMVMVPREPTPEMIIEGSCAVKPGGFIEDIYAAMIAAAPPAAPAPSNQLSGNSGGLNLIAPAPVVPAKCDGGTCGLGGYCVNCPKQIAAPVVPLTDKQINNIADALLDNGGCTMLTLARAIEKAHGIEGGGK